MNPILLGRHVEQGLRELVHSTLNTTSSDFEGAVERFLENPNHFMKGPWVTVDLPFKNIVDASGNWSQPFPEIPLIFAPYIHQAKAFERLTAQKPLSTLVATGTGSGKTESYLWPILDYCRQHADKPGIKAILIYPMNALATDQARRVAAAITNNASLKNVRAGIYADAEPRHAADEVTADSLITRRETMRQNPPDILLTNYKMLDYLLLRGDDLPLWSKNDPESLRFLVVDEMHTFDGAQGSDLALLIRRLKHRLAMPENHLVCVGSSATLGSGDDAIKDLIQYAETIFGERFEGDAVVRETRVTASEALSHVEYFDTPDYQLVIDALKQAEDASQVEAAKILATCLFDDESDVDLIPLYTSSPDGAEFRLLLGRLIKEHWVGQRLIETIDAHTGPISLDDLSSSLAKAKPLKKWPADAVQALAELVVSLISWARSGQPEAMRPLFNLRSQVWLREMARIVATIPRMVDDKLIPCEIHHADDLDRNQLEDTLPIVNCQRCGSTAHIGREDPGKTSYYASLDTIYEEFFEGGNSSTRLRLFYTDPISLVERNVATQRVFPGLLNPQSLEFVKTNRQLDREDGQVPAWMYSPSVDGKIDRTCPACGHAQGLLLFGLRATRMSSAVSSILFASEQNEELDEAKPRFLLFSDSVQDAAQRGAVTEVRNTQSVIQKSLYQRLVDKEIKNKSLVSLFQDFPSDARAKLGDDHFTASYIPKDFSWRRAYQQLVSNSKAVNDSFLLRSIEWRLGWSVFEDLTYKSHLPTSLEGQGVACCDIRYKSLNDTAEKFTKQLANQFSDLNDLEPKQVQQFIFGVVQRLRRQGSVSHPYLRKAIEKLNSKGFLGDFAASRMLGLDRGMPPLSPRNGLSPRAVSLYGSERGLDNIVADSPTNWFKDWLQKVLLGDKLSLSNPKDVYQLLFDRLIIDGILQSIHKNDDSAEPPRAYLVDSSVLTASSEVSYLVCNKCSRKEVALKINESCMIGASCTRLYCEGELVIDDCREKKALLRGLSTPRNHRVVAREHTGLLDADERLSIEDGFINGESIWSPNLISATPTLEMGIDIGDLSTLMLCSVPPEEANYVQRMGRTGRRDGNALNFVLANARAHDLQFWDDPSPMLKGEVKAPGVYIAAESVLLRQITAFSLDSFVKANELKGDFGKVSEVRKRREAGHVSGFPLNWFTFIADEGNGLAHAFISLLPDEVKEQKTLVSRLENFVISDDPASMRWNVIKVFEDADLERARFVDKREELTKEKRKLKSRRAEYTDEEFKKLEDAIESDRKQINRLIRKGIDEVPVIKFLTDKGCLPNYAFPEEGVKLTSLLSRHERDSSGDEDGLYSIEYQRPASSALSEFALGQTFYANGRQVEISRLEMSNEDLIRWRFCPTCSHVANVSTSDAEESCPKCGDEMWSDTGSVHDVVELKSVLAISPEDKTSIKDTDHRTQVQYDRAIIPEYKSEDITSAWISEDEEVSALFGYEFISHCIFRDFNFGKRADGPVGAKIAGNERNSRPFRICKHCGSSQSPFLSEIEKGVHPPSCVVIKNNIENQSDWISESYLMRSFETEAIRVIIPVVGDASHDELKSFVAAINLGMRKYFAGRVDHIRSAVIEAQIDGMSRLRSLFLYDAVPGGSGYLRQLSDNPASLKAVIQSAFKALDECPCANEEKTGCYRCVKSYRSQFGPGEPNRDIARSMMESILKQWDSLRKSKETIDHELSHSLIRSELEALFLQALKKKFGESSLTPKVVGEGNRGFVLSTGAGMPLWTIEPQVQVQGRFKNMPKKLVDFVMTPIGSSHAKPIIIETDGIKYHAETVVKDIQDRLEMIRTGLVNVWSLSWHDLQAGNSKSFANPLSSEALPPASQHFVSNVLANERFNKHKDTVGMLQDSGSFDLLVNELAEPGSFDQGLLVYLRGIVGQGRPVIELDGIADLRDENSDWLSINNLAAKTFSQGVDLFCSLGKVQPSAFETMTDDIRLLINFTSKPSTSVEEISDEFTSAFRGFWRSLNILQKPPGLHVEYPGMDTLSLPLANDLEEQDLDSQWSEVRANVMDEYLPMVDALIAAQISAPDLIGEELMVGSRVIGCAEMGWSAHQLWVTDDDSIELEGVIYWDLEMSRLPEVIAKISSAVN